MNTPNAVTETKINRDIAGTMHLGDRGLELANLDQVLELAKMMAISGPAVPKHLRGQPGTCLGVIAQAARMGLDPFAAAAKSYVVNDQLAYEAQLFSAIANTHPTFQQRPDAVFEGEGANRRCTVTAQFRDGAVRQYTSPRFADIQPKNSPLWKNDPDQQLFYTSIRAFIRRWCPEIMLGIRDAEELREAAMQDITPAAERPAAPKSLDDFAAAAEAGRKSSLDSATAGGVSSDPSPAQESPALNPHQAAGEGSDESPVIPLDDGPLVAAADRSEAIDKLLALAADPDTTTQEKLENLDGLVPAYVDTYGRDFAETAFETIAKVVRGELKPAAAKKYLGSLK